MLAPLRSSVGSTARSAARRSALQPATAALGRRTLMLKEEVWSPEQHQAARDQGLLPGKDGKPTMDLSKILPNIEARWKEMPNEEQIGVYQHLDVVQQKDWKELTIDEKKASYYVAFGPHGPRKPTTYPGQKLHVFFGTMGIVLASTGFFYFIRSFAAPPPKTMTTEYQEQMNERAKNDKMNPIKGISSEDYKGPGFVQKSYA